MRKKIGLAVLALFVFLWGWAIIQTQRSLIALKSGQIDLASQRAKTISWLATTTRTLTLHQISLVNAWWAGLGSIQLADETQLAAINYGQNLFSLPNEPLYRDKLVVNFIELSQKLDVLQTSLQKSLLPIDQTLLDQIQLAHQLTQISLDQLNQTTTYAFVFQNTHELRATGGFAGSYAKLSLEQGQLREFKLEDIYVPDGLFSGYVEPPPGVKKYLSGGESLRLRDANWHPDFPSSAQMMLNYLSWGNETGYDGLIALNLPVVEAILELTGPVAVPDYDQVVTADNFAQIARIDRDQFFPGSQQKQHFLSIFFNQLVFEIASLEPAEQQQLLQILIDQAGDKQIQFYSTQNQLQTIFSQYHLSGELLTNPAGYQLMLVESNVGINKANQAVERAVKLEFSPSTLTIQLDFTNYNQASSVNPTIPNQADNLTYSNYQRVIINPEITVTSIKIDDQSLTEWDETLITNSSGNQFKEIGFLVQVPEESSRQVKIMLQVAAMDKSWLIQKQAGLETVPYQIISPDYEGVFDLTNQHLISL